MGSEMCIRDRSTAIPVSIPLTYVPSASPPSPTSPTSTTPQLSQDHALPLAQQPTTLRPSTAQDPISALPVISVAPSVQAILFLVLSVLQVITCTWIPVLTLVLMDGFRATTQGQVSACSVQFSV